MDESLQNLAAEFADDFPEPPSTSASSSNVAKSDENSATKERNFNNLLVNNKQRGNPLLKAVRNVPWSFDDIVPDYQMGTSVCALFLSLRYHTLNPDYIHQRLKDLGKSFDLRILLALVRLFLIRYNI